MSDDANRPENPGNPFEEMLRQLGLTGPGGAALDPQQLLARLQAELGPMMSPGAEDKGLDLAQTKNVARHVVAAQGADPTPSDRDRREVTEAVELADAWLDDATSFPGGGKPRAWSRAEWVEATMPTLSRLVEPVALHLTDAVEGLLAGGLAGGDAAAAGLPDLGAMMRPMLRRSAAAMFSGNAGQAIGKLGSVVLSGTDLGLPLLESGEVALLPTNIAEFADGLEVAPREVRLYLALREAARQRVFAGVPWLRTQLLALVEHYAREITIDGDALEQAFGGVEQMGQLDPAQLQQVAERINGAILRPPATPEQKEVLGRLEVLLALVEGWVDDVVAQVTARWLPQAPALVETLRRRRAAGGPAEEAMKALFGLELRPRRLREAANLWAALRDARGPEGRDDVWLHPDLLPTGADLDDPLGYVSGESRAAQTDDLDEELRRLLEAEGGA